MNGNILLDHGSGGLASQDLIGSLFLKYLKDPILHELEDAALLKPEKGRLVFSTDSYVVDPLQFPGGDIGELAINGTINDLAMRGANPLYLSLGVILEEGFPFSQLEEIVKSIADASKYAGVPVVTGDTKVVPKGKADKIFINTSGIGVVEDNVEVKTSRAQPGDIIIISGTLADHGITILTNREGLQVSGKIQSDTAPLHFLVKRLLDEMPDAIHTMRDPTRGGLGTTLCEIAKVTNLCMDISEKEIPMHGEVRAACELMGLDPLYLANEGKCIVIAAPDQAEIILQTMRSIQEGRESAIIGKVTEKYPGKVVMTTMSGGRRLVVPLSGEPLPRIC
ncbi:MAG TPA: hydrogenase expression/formation protein HypE [Desulfobacterales bacterium]|nr:hydrogenase expression/formation protein HypE [Desulfobacterales bacterium]HIP39919.1 hydrogenase expression/formation protein HypE [Desulfocapsa sulfexigens]